MEIISLEMSIESELIIKRSDIVYKFSIKFSFFQPWLSFLDNMTDDNSKITCI